METGPDLSALLGLDNVARTAAKVKKGSMAAAGSEEDDENDSEDDDEAERKSAKVGDSFLSLSRSSLSKKKTSFQAQSTVS